jgi:hypothetical protein
MLRRRDTLALLAAALPTAALAQGAPAGGTWPDRPVRIIVPAPGGAGTADTVARIMAGEMEKRLPQRVVVENRGGANGNIGAVAAARSAPDGYTLLWSWAGTLATNMALYRDPGFDPVRDFEPVVLVGNVPNILVVNRQLGVADMAAFTEYARRNPGAINFGSTGNGSSMHLAGELYRQMTRTEMVHVPYQGPAPATTDLLSNRIQAMFNLITGAAPQVRAGPGGADRRALRPPRAAAARGSDDRRGRAARPHLRHLVRHPRAQGHAGADPRRGEPRGERGDRRPRGQAAAGGGGAGALRRPALAPRAAPGDGDPPPRRDRARQREPGWTDARAGLPRWLRRGARRAGAGHGRHLPRLRRGGGGGGAAARLALLCSATVYGMAGQLVLLGLATTPGATVLPAVVAATAANAASCRCRWRSRRCSGAAGRGGWRCPSSPSPPGRRRCAGCRRWPSRAARLVPRLRAGLLERGAGGDGGGHLLAPVLPPSLRAALLFANPLYFALLLAADLGRPGVRGGGDRRRAGGAARHPARPGLGAAGGGTDRGDGGLPPGTQAVSGADLALLLTVLAGLGLRGAGLALGGALRPDHPFIAWASAVSVATLSAFVVLAIAAPSGLLATVPWPARLAGVAAGGLGWLAFRGATLPALLAGLAGLMLARLALFGG